MPEGAPLPLSLPLARPPLASFVRDRRPCPPALHHLPNAPCPRVGGPRGQAGRSSAFLTSAWKLEHKRALSCFDLSTTTAGACHSSSLTQFLQTGIAPPQLDRQRRPHSCGPGWAHWVDKAWLRADILACSTYWYRPAAVGTGMAAWWGQAALTGIHFAAWGSLI